MLDNFDVEVLKSNGYTTVYDLFMGIKKDNYKMYRGKFNWEGDNSTIQGIYPKKSKTLTSYFFRNYPSKQQVFQ